MGTGTSQISKVGVRTEQNHNGVYQNRPVDREKIYPDPNFSEKQSVLEDVTISLSTMHSYLRVIFFNSVFNI